MSVAVVAGAYGAIGRHVVAELRATGSRVAGIGHGPERWDADIPIDLWAPGELTAEALDRVAARLGPPAVLVNAAGGASVPRSFEDPGLDFERTVSAAVRLLEWIRTASPTTRFVCVSSAAVYGTGHSGPIPEETAAAPMSPYGFHKLMAEQATRSWAAGFGVPAVIVRLFSVYGPGLRKQLVYELIERAAAAPARLELAGTGRETRDWLWIADAARILCRAADLASEDVPVINGCTGRGRSVAEVAGLIVRNFGHGAEVCFNGRVRSGDPADLVGSAERLQTTGFQPQVSLEDGLAQLVAARRRNG